jgi:hypothetical protein
MMQPPEGYRVEDDCVMSNVDHQIDPDLEARLRREKVVLQYAGRNFSGEVWYDPEHQLFRCIVSVHGIAREMVSRLSLDEVMWYVCDEYGPE